MSRADESKLVCVQSSFPFFVSKYTSSLLDYAQYFLFYNDIYKLLIKCVRPMVWHQ